MRIAPALPFVLLTACEPPAVEIPPAPPPARSSIEIYMHPDGKTNCVEEESGEWRANPKCCPDGFEPAGFSAPTATLYLDDDDSPNRRIYRHLICLERR